MSSALFRVDASPRMGGGHVMRCLTLADELKGRGWRTHFLSAALPLFLSQRLAEGGHGVSLIAPPEAPDLADADWDKEPLPDTVQEEDARRCRAALDPDGFDWIVVDHYGLSRPWEQAIRSKGAGMMVIDDLANRDHLCALLVDQTFGRDPADYSPLVPPSCTIAAGADYAPLRPEFAAAREAALARRQQEGPAERLLISLGSTDVGGITGRVIDALLDARFDGAIDVVLGPSAPSLDRVRRAADANSNLRLHVDSRDMAGLMAAADLAIGAAGTTSWERCCLGLPALVLVLAANQHYIADRLDAWGAHRAFGIDHLNKLVAEAARLWASASERRQMSARAAQVTDGGGAARLAELMQRNEGRMA